VMAARTLSVHVSESILQLIDIEARALLLVRKSAGGKAGLDVIRIRGGRRGGAVAPAMEFVITSPRADTKDAEQLGKRTDASRT